MSFTNIYKLISQQCLFTVSMIRYYTITHVHSEYATVNFGVKSFLSPKVSVSPVSGICSTNKFPPQNRFVFKLWQNRIPSTGESFSHMFPIKPAINCGLNHVTSFINYGQTPSYSTCEWKYSHIAIYNHYIHIYNIYIYSYI